MSLICIRIYIVRVYHLRLQCHLLIDHRTPGPKKDVLGSMMIALVSGMVSWLEGVCFDLFSRVIGLCWWCYLCGMGFFFYFLLQFLFKIKTIVYPPYRYCILLLYFGFYFIMTKTVSSCSRIDLNRSKFFLKSILAVLKNSHMYFMISVFFRFSITGIRCTFNPFVYFKFVGETSL